VTAAQELAHSTAMQVLDSGVEESHMTLTVINGVIRRLSVISGQRSIVIISPGFLTPQMESEYMASIDRALRARVVINGHRQAGAGILSRAAQSAGLGGRVNRFSVGGF
jgi:hypothetical protein